MDKKTLLTLAKITLKEAKKVGCTDAETVVSAGTEELTRFANSEIHQSVSLTDSFLHIRIIFGKKIGVARTNRFDTEGIRACVGQAAALAKLQKEDPDFLKLPEKTKYTSTRGSYGKAEHLGPLGRARAIKVIVDKAKQAKLVASGAFSESESDVLVANTNGVLAYHSGKSASLTTILMGAKGSGFASHSAHGGLDINARDVADRAVAKATMGEIVDVPPGEYEVILEPPAVAELLDFFAWLGPNARIYHEDVSFYQGNLGKRLFHETLSITDNPLDPRGYPMAFDFEGAPKNPVALVDKGKLISVVYDSYHAYKYNKKNTGHALLAPNTWGPTPNHIIVSPGTQTTEELISHVKKGLLVTRFWYTRVVQHKQLTLTGMTRDGTFYIENGKIVGRAKNLRYTQSIVEALRDIRGIGKRLELHGSEGSPSLVPHIHLGKFRFTGVTKHG